MINLKKQDPVADVVRDIMEKELKGNQTKLDKNQNGKLDNQDFKILRGQKKTTEDVESVEENAFDYKSPQARNQPFRV
jgi:cobyric acid synthase